MGFNKYTWDIYKNSEAGKNEIELFENGAMDSILSKYLGKFHLSVEDTTNFIDELNQFSINPLIPEEMQLDDAEKLFSAIAKNGIKLKYENGENGEIESGTNEILSLIPVISSWLFYNYPDYFYPHFFSNRFHILRRIADAFEINLPVVPLKKEKRERLFYYWSLCKTFYEFREEFDMTYSEFLAFLYDFAPNYISHSDIEEDELPQPTQVWMIGGDKFGTDFEFIDTAKKGDTSRWQGNLETKRGDILIMYCLSPRSYIHSIWRAVNDGFADPFFYWYSNIIIGNKIKVSSISIHDLKADPHFKLNPLVRKNLQGLNGYPLSAEDYLQLQKMIVAKGGTVKNLPQLYSPSIKLNKTLTNEKEVETVIIEPFLLNLGYTPKQWVRQLPVRMGRGERNFPDYAFLTNNEKGFESASMLIESKFHIKNNQELEETFKQVWSYGQRLSSSKLIIADKDSIWIYLKHNGSFDRSKYLKKFWEELATPDEFSKIKKIIGAT